MEYKSFKFDEVQAREGLVKGLLSPYNNVDHGRDVVRAGAFTKTLHERKNRVPALYQHNWDQPIGVNFLTDGSKGLDTEIKLNLNKQLAKEVLSDVEFWQEHGLSFGLSIGYETINEKFDGGVRELTEIKLWEGSLVTFPMNDDARVHDAKELARAWVDMKAGRVVSAANRRRLESIASEISALLTADEAEEAAATQNEPQESALVEQIKSLVEHTKWN